MAELVNLRIEHTLPELAEMERIQLFKTEEIHKIVKKRRALEYKLRRSHKTKEDFLKYIEYEVNLLSLISKKRKYLIKELSKMEKELGTSLKKERRLIESKKKEIDDKVGKRINRLFKAAISRFPDDPKLLLDQILFNKKMKWYDEVKKLHNQMLRAHARNPSVLIIAAKWEMEGMGCPESARNIFFNGLKMNPDSKILWREYFRMELMYIDLIKKRMEVLQSQKIEKSEAVKIDAILSGEVLKVVFGQAVEAVQDDVEFALSFIQILMEFNFAFKHIDYILNEVKKLYPRKEETLDALAKKPLINLEEKIKKAKEHGIRKKETLESIGEEIFSSYEAAVKEVPTEKMWSFYIDYLLTSINSSKESKKRKLQERLNLVMRQAASLENLSATYYPEWIDLLLEQGEESEALSLSLEAARKWNRVDLWFKALALHIQCMQPSKQIYAYLMEAINAVPEKDSIILWKIGVEWISVCSAEKLSEFFEIGIKRGKEVSVPLQEMYLEVTALESGIEAARALYKKFKKLGPIYWNITTKMIMIEKGQLKPSIDFLRQYYEDAILESGDTNIDVWLDYMKLETEHENGNSSNFDTVLWRAKKTLNSEHLPAFHNNLTSGNVLNKDHSAES